jgi:hypothetical protein
MFMSPDLLDRMIARTQRTSAAKRSAAIAALPLSRVDPSDVPSSRLFRISRMLRSAESAFTRVVAHRSTAR